MKGLIISLVVLVVLTTMVIPIYGRGGKGGSNLRVIDANGLILGKVVGIEGGGRTANVSSTVGGELVIFYLIDGGVQGSTEIVFFETVDDCTGQAYTPDFGLELILTAVVDVDNSVYKVLDRDPGLFKSFTVESQLPRGSVCEDVSFFITNLLPATRLGDLSGFTLPFEYFE